MLDSKSELQRQRLLLEIEYNTEKEEFRRQTATMGLLRKVKRGDCWFPVSVGRCYYNSLNQFVIEITRNEDSDIEHNFEFGRPVCFFAVDRDEKLKYFDFTATVSYVKEDLMVLVIPEIGIAIELQNVERLGVQIFFDETSYKLMFEALDRTINAKDNRLAYLRDLFYSSMKSEKFTFNSLRFPWLNRTQEEAVNQVLWAKDVAVVHGPPGTGKTTTLVEAIYEILHRENQVLVCAQSNMAVDWISEKLVDRGVNVLRIGNPTRVNDKMLSFTYERRFESHPEYPQLWSIRKMIREIKSNRRHTDSWHQKIERLKDRAMELEIKINADLFGEARVIASTLTGSANRILERQKFGTLFIDEAAQALEAACWIAIRKATRVILAGDHCQLPPTVKSIAALKGGLDKTLMERIVENKPETVTLLKMQYRMNEQIMRFSSDWFYHGEIESAPEIKYRGILDWDMPMVWIDTSEMDSKEEFVGESFGRINKEEAALTLSTLSDYFDKIGKQRVLDECLDVGIISPYRAQVQYMRKLIKMKENFKPFRQRISVNTVDGFQGQERDIVIISLVRANDEGQIGFLCDLRRMNVAITRARMKLMIIGNSKTMTHHPFYRKLYDYVQGLNEL
jgi:superfamily I DNA and/or RNA helicase